VDTVSLAGRSLPGIVTRPLAQATRPPKSRLVRLLQRILERLRPRPPLLNEVAELVERLRPDILWVNGSHLVPLVARVPHHSRSLWIIDTLDVMHLRDASLRQAGLPEQCGVSRSEEVELLDRFDLVLAIQKEERDVLQQMLPQKQVIVVGHACEPDPQPAWRQAVVFVGSNGPSNVHAVETFVNLAWPAVLQACPDARLEVVGSVGRSKTLQDLAVRPNSGIVLRGTVDRIADAYRGAAVVVCPLWAGSGLKIKLVEALSHGKAVVASPIAAQGLDDGIGVAFLTAETPESFAPAVVGLLMNGRRREKLQAAAIRYAARRFGPATVYAELDEALGNWSHELRCPGKAA
jgi:glycosyltransferase involved in cell wall biosynthesis